MSLRRRSRLIAGVVLFATFGLAPSGWAGIELAPALRVAPIEPGKGTTGLAAGPIFFYERHPSRLEWGLRPLTSSVRNDEISYYEFDLLYPLLTQRSRPTGVDGQLLQLLRWSTMRTPGGSSTDWMLFPLVAYQGEQPTRPGGGALFPLYGSLHQFLGQNRLQFALFPLWLSLERDQITRRFILWPFFSWTRPASETAPPVRGWKFWPFYGEFIQAGMKEERFVLWPFFLHQRLALNSDAPQERWLLLPFYSSIHSPTEHSTWWLWPLSFGRTVTTAPRYEEWDLPWPLIQFGSGDKRSIRRVFPFYSEESRTRTVDLLGKSQRVDSSSRIILWPLYHSTSEIGPDWRRDRDRLLLLLYSDVRTQQANKSDGRRIDLWPLFTYNKTPEGVVRFQTLAPIEPFLNTEPITRNYSPLWSLATYSRDQDAAEFSLLWGVFRWTATEREHRLRFFFLPSIHWTRATPPPSDTAAGPPDLIDPTSPVDPPAPPDSIDPAGPIGQTP